MESGGRDHSGIVPELLGETLCDLYDAEHRIAELLPKLADATDSRSLRTCYREQFERSMRRIFRIEAVCAQLGIKAQRATARMVERLVAEAETSATGIEVPAVRDVALIGYVQKILSYCLAGYRSAKAWADALNKGCLAEALEAMAADESRSLDRFWSIVEARVAAR